MNPPQPTCSRTRHLLFPFWPIHQKLTEEKESWCLPSSSSTLHGLDLWKRKIKKWETQWGFHISYSLFQLIFKSVPSQPKLLKQKFIKLFNKESVKAALKQVFWSIAYRLSGTTEFQTMFLKLTVTVFQSPVFIQASRATKIWLTAPSLVKENISKKSQLLCQHLLYMVKINSVLKYSYFNIKTTSITPHRWLHLA